MGKRNGGQCVKKFTPMPTLFHLAGLNYLY